MSIPGQPLNEASTFSLKRDAPAGQLRIVTLPFFPQAESLCKNWLTFKNASTLINSSGRLSWGLLCGVPVRGQGWCGQADRTKLFTQKLDSFKSALKSCLPRNFWLTRKGTWEGYGTQCSWESQLGEYSLFWAPSRDWPLSELGRALLQELKQLCCLPAGSEMRCCSSLWAEGTRVDYCPPVIPANVLPLLQDHKLNSNQRTIRVRAFLCRPWRIERPSTLTCLLLLLAS